MSFPEKLHLDHNWFPPSDSEASQCFWLPRSTWCELLGNGARGRTPPPAGRLLRQHHQCPGCKERSPAAFTEGPQQNCAVSDGEGVDIIRAKKNCSVFVYNFWNFQQQSLTDKQKTHQKCSFFFQVAKDLIFSGSSDTAVHTHNVHVSDTKVQSYVGWMYDKVMVRCRLMPDGMFLWSCCFCFVSFWYHFFCFSQTGDLLTTYRGHKSAVTSIVVLGTVMVTACLDGLVRVFNLQVLTWVCTKLL